MNIYKKNCAYTIKTQKNDKKDEIIYLAIFEFCKKNIESKNSNHRALESKS